MSRGGTVPCCGRARGPGESACGSGSDSSTQKPGCGIVTAFDAQKKMKQRHSGMCRRLAASPQMSRNSSDRCSCALHTHWAAAFISRVSLPPL
eukprot:2222110-Prymnesium_polylepis.3